MTAQRKPKGKRSARQARPARRRSAPKSAPTKTAKKKALRRRIAPVQVQKSSGKITITYDQPHLVLPQLLTLASEFAKQHFASATYTTADQDVLGTEGARKVVFECSKSDCWICTLADLHLDSVIFQSCVFNGVQSKGYFIARDRIPASQDTQLYTVVMAIQNATKKE